MRMVPGLTALLLISQKAALVAEVAPGALAERNRAGALAVMVVTAVTGSPGQEESEKMVQPVEPATILAETGVTALVDPPRSKAPAVAVVAAATVVAVVQPPRLVVLAVALVGPVNKEQQKSATTVQEMVDLALPEVMGQ